MAIAIEKAVSRSHSNGQQRTVEVSYLIQGTDDDVVALQVLEQHAPVSHAGLPRLDWTIEQTGPDTWEGVVRYGSTDRSGQIKLEAGDVRIQARSGGGTEHITIPIAQLAKYPDNAPKAEGIGDDGRGHLAGVDIHGWRYEFTVTKVFASGTDAPPENTLARMQNKMNASVFEVTDTRTGRTIHGEPGEVLFLSHETGDPRPDGAFEVTYHFALRPNRTGVQVPGTSIVVSEWPGWAYLWVRTEEKKDETSKRLYTSVVGVYLDQVYESADFAALGI